MSRITSFCEWLLQRAIVWGGMGCLAFYVLVVQRCSADATIHRYFAGEAATLKGAAALLFFVGVAALVMRWLATVVQLGNLDRTATAPAVGAGGVEPALEDWLTDLELAPAAIRDGYLVRRLRSASEYVKQTGLTGALDQNLRRLEDADRRRMAEGYAMIRAVTGCILLCGLTGVVVGGGAALYQFAPPEVQHSLPAPLASPSAGLDVFVQGLALAMLLAFAKLNVERTENRLLTAVDEAAYRQLAPLMTRPLADQNPQVGAIARMCEHLLQTVDAAIARHDASVTKALGTASRRWDEAASTTAALLNRTIGEALAAGLKEHANALNEGVVAHTANLEATLVRHAEILSENIDNHTGALAEALEHHAAVVTETEQSLAAENQRHLANMGATLGEAMLVSATRQEELIRQSEGLLSEMQAALAGAAETTAAHQQQLARQSEVLLKVVEATGQVRKLEEALNSNLSALAASHNFEHTVTSLAAVVQLLSTKLRHPMVLHSEIDLGDDETTSQAA